MAKGHRGKAKQELTRASNNLDNCLDHLVRVRNMADEDDHPKIRDYLDKIGKSVMQTQVTIEQLENNL